MPDIQGPILLGIFYLYLQHLYIYFFPVKRNQKLLQSLCSEFLMNFINQADKFRTGPEREKKKKVMKRRERAPSCVSPGWMDFPCL